MSARGSMTMRADIEQNNVAGVDGYGQPLIPNWASKTVGVACRVYAKMKREVIDGDKTALVEDIRALFSLSANVVETDRIANVKDRRGTVIFTGPLIIETIQKRKDHAELALKRAHS